MPSAQIIAANHEVEEAFVELLKEAASLAGEDIVAASNRDALVGPQHVFVYCPIIAPIPRIESNGFADVTVAVVSDMDDLNHAARKARVEKVASVLTQTPQAFGMEDKLWVCGWTVAGPRETSEGRQVADVFNLRAGVSLSSPNSP